MKNRSVCFAAFALLASAGVANAQFDINVVFGAGLTPSQQAIFSQAESIWESLVTGYRPGISVTGITINASGPTIDGPGGALGNAGPSSMIHQGGFYVATTGNMNFDSADLASMESGGYLLPVILHEMGHVMGIGTLWNINGVYASGSGQYTGAFGVAAYATEFNQPGATFIPVEMDGGPGTAEAHWNEDNAISSLQGNMSHELMTGWIDIPWYISDTTAQSLRDIGFTVVPTPGAAAVLAMGGLVMGRRRR